MAFLLILDREHKALLVKSKNKSSDNSWFLPEVEDPINKPLNQLNVELLAKQAFIPLKSSLIGKKTIFDLFKNEQQLYLFLCPGKESSEVLFDLTKYRNIQWIPINCIGQSECFSTLSGKSIIDSYYDILLGEFTEKKVNFHIIKNGYGEKDTEEYNKEILYGQKNILLELVEQYNLYHQSIPKIGDYALLNSWEGLPVAALEIIEVNIKPFAHINSFLKESTNEKDFSQKDTQEKYRKIFLKWCKKNNKQFSINKSVVISKFKIIRRFKEKKIDHLDLS